LQELRAAPGAAESAEAEWSVAYLHSPRHHLQHRPVTLAPSHKALDNPNLLLRDFLQERWRGLTPVLWGRQLKQERLDELIYLGIMNIDHLPPDSDRSPLTEFWQQGAQEGEVSDG
jgi:glycerol-3-phosphate dehydrogenase